MPVLLVLMNRWSIVPIDGAGDFYEKEFYENEEYSVPGSEDCLYLNIWAPKERGIILVTVNWITVLTRQVPS